MGFDFTISVENVARKPDDEIKKKKKKRLLRVFTDNKFTIFESIQ